MSHGAPNMLAESGARCLIPGTNAVRDGQSRTALARPCSRCIADVGQ